MAGIFSPNLFSRGIFSCLWPFASLNVALELDSSVDVAFTVELIEMPTVNVGDTKTLTFRLKAGSDVLTLADITTLTITFRDMRTYRVINSRDDQNAKNANGVTVATNGTITWETSALDNIIVDPTLKTETHRALFVCTYDGGRVGSGEVDVVVHNTEKLG